MIKDAPKDNWHRVAPIAILHFTVKAITRLANLLLYTIPALALNYQKVLAQPQLIILALCGILLVIVAYATLSYLLYSFRLHSNRIEIKSGILKRAHIDLPYEKIQNVRVEEPFYYRLHKFACLELDTAGSSKQEARIVAIPLTQAMGFKQQILGQKDSASHALDSQDAGNSTSSQSGTAAEPDTQRSYPHDSDVDISDSKEILLNERSLKDLVIHGICNNRVWLLLGALAPFYQSISTSIFEFFESKGIDLTHYFSASSVQWWQLIIYALSLTMLILLIMVGFSIAGSILTYYQYRLSLIDTRLVRRSGLVSKQEVSIRLSRLQLISFKQDWLDKLLGRINLYFAQNSSGPQNNQQAHVQNTNKLLVPSVTTAEARELAKNAWQDIDIKALSYQTISKHFIARYALFICLPLTLAGLGVSILSQQAHFLALGLGLSLICLLAIYIRWRKWGIADDSDYIYIRKGFVGVDHHVFPKYKLQQSRFKQSIFMRSKHLATAQFVLASGGLSVPFLNEKLAQDLLNSGLRSVEEAPQSWM